MPEALQRATLSVAIITFNEEENIGRTLASVKGIADEIIVVDSGSSDRTVEIAEQFGARVFIEEWKGFAAQKNSALDKCKCDWILSLDADEEASKELATDIVNLLAGKDLGYPLRPWGPTMYRKEKPEAFVQGGARSKLAALFVPRRNHFLAKWVRRGGFYPDAKLRLFRRECGRFASRRVHEDLELLQPWTDKYAVWANLKSDLIHHQYPTLTAYIEHMNRYSSLGAEMVVEKRGRVRFSILNIVVRPIATFLYNYFFRFGFLDGKEGLLLHLYHSVYVSWKYAKAWELSRKSHAGSTTTSRTK
jgi:glycosyltransferase involved in cell wall biosynthesis